MDCVTYRGHNTSVFCVQCLPFFFFEIFKRENSWTCLCIFSDENLFFDMCSNFFIQAFRRAGWLPKDENEFPKCTHVGFGLVLGEDGKRFRTRSSDTIRLVELLDEAKKRCKASLLERGKVLVTQSDFYLFLICIQA